MDKLDHKCVFISSSLVLFVVKRDLMTLLPVVPRHCCVNWGAGDPSLLGARQACYKYAQQTKLARTDSYCKVLNPPFQR